MAEQKFVFIYGAGISGCGVAELAAKKGQRVLLFNDEEKAITPELLHMITAHGGLYICNKDVASYLEATEVMVVSPGVPMKKPLIAEALQRGIKVVGEAEVALRDYRGHLVAITGTNGKTTTTTLVGAMFACLPVKSAVGGNIGLALSTEVETLGPEDWLIAELSSFQLEAAATLKPDIAAILNITPDHMDRHGTMEEYTRVKANIFARQTAEDYLILNYEDERVAVLAAKAPSSVCFFSAKRTLPEGIFVDNGVFVLSWRGQRIEFGRTSQMKIFGAHNVENALAAIACAHFGGVSRDDIEKVLSSFEGVEHRLEYVTSIGGIPYYNDSKATNPDSTIKALESFDGGLILLAGGYDKHTDLTAMMNLIKLKTDALILLGEAKERFYEAAKKAGVSNIYLVDTFAEGVYLAHSLAQKSETVLLSPACASYDMFENFPARGRAFKELVLGMAGK